MCKVIMICPILLLLFVENVDTLQLNFVEMHFFSVFFRKFKRTKHIFVLKFKFQAVLT